MVSGKAFEGGDGLFGEFDFVAGVDFLLHDDGGLALGLEDEPEGGDAVVVLDAEADGDFGNGGGGGVFGGGKDFDDGQVVGFALDAEGDGFDFAALSVGGFDLIASFAGLELKVERGEGIFDAERSDFAVLKVEGGFFDGGAHLEPELDEGAFDAGDVGVGKDFVGLQKVGGRSEKGGGTEEVGGFAVFHEGGVRLAVAGNDVVVKAGGATGEEGFELAFFLRSFHGDLGEGAIGFVDHDGGGVGAAAADEGLDVGEVGAGEAVVGGDDGDGGEGDVRSGAEEAGEAGAEVLPAGEKKEQDYEGNRAAADPTEGGLVGNDFGKVDAVEVFLGAGHEGLGEFGRDALAFELGEVGDVVGGAQHLSQFGMGGLDFAGGAVGIEAAGGKDGVTNDDGEGEEREGPPGGDAHLRADSLHDVEDDYGAGDEDEEGENAAERSDQEDALGFLDEALQGPRGARGIHGQVGPPLLGWKRGWGVVMAHGVRRRGFRVRG